MNLLELGPELGSGASGRTVGKVEDWRRTLVIDGTSEVQVPRDP